MRPITEKSCIKIVDVRPKGCHKKYDCTTRCLTYCLNEDYWKMRQEQDAESKKKYGTPKYWNYDQVWTQPLYRRGWKKIVLKRKMARFNLAKVIGHIDCRIATHSSRHAAAMDHGNVIDSWNSEGGRVDYIIVPPEHYEEMYELVGPVFKMGKARKNNTKQEKTMKKQNEAKVEEQSAAKGKKTVENMSMFELMKVIEHNTKRIERLSMKMDRLTTLNAELKEQLKSKIENI